MKRLFLWFTASTLITFIICMLIDSKDQYSSSKYHTNHDLEDDVDMYEDDEYDFDGDLFEEE